MRDEVIAAAVRNARPLAVDLDGTLVRSDTLHEGIVTALKARPGGLLKLYGALRRSKASFKRSVATEAPFDAALLPYNRELLAYLRTQKQAGRTIGLFTAADQSIADAVATHLGLFDVARGSDGVTNLSGSAKADAIAAAFGPDFAYAGDGLVDLPIFARAAGIILVGDSARLRAGLSGSADVEASFPAAPAGLSTWAKALRLRHWSKNALVFVAPVLAPPSLPVLAQAVLLFLLMGSLASATYLLNDILDLVSDRQHPRKRDRPLAAGAIRVRDGVLVAGMMVAASLVLSLALPLPCTLVLLAYLVVTLAYSLLLKQLAMVDVTVLAGLFTLRVLAGSLLLATPVSPWLLTFSMLFFFGLAVIKRYAELERLVLSGASQVRARGYTHSDQPILLASGVASGFAAIVIFMIYLINDQYPRAIYANPGALWCVMPALLIWTLRLWHLAVHGKMSEDPVMFALKDRVSLALGAVVAIILLVARL